MPSTTSRQRLRAAWMLVCMLPYLFIAMMGEGMHNHPLLDSGSGTGLARYSLHTLDRQATSTSGHAAGPAQSQQVGAGQLKHGDPDCPACRWSASSASQLVILPRHLSPSLEIVRIAVPGATLWQSRTTASAQGRGPPQA